MKGRVELNEKSARVSFAAFSRITHFALIICPVFRILPIALGLLGNNPADLGAMPASERVGISQVVLAQMVGMVGDNKILNPVVIFDAVDVVDYFGREQFATNGVLHHESMMENGPTANSDTDIAIARLPRQPVLISPERSIPISVFAPVMLSAKATADSKRLATWLDAFISHGDIVDKRFI